MSEEKLPRLVKIREACVYARMSRSKMYQKIKDETIHAYRRDGSTMIDLNSIDAMNSAAKRIMPKARNPNPTSSS